MLRAFTRSVMTSVGPSSSSGINDNLFCFCRDIHEKKRLEQIKWNPPLRIFVKPSATEDLKRIPSDCKWDVSSYYKELRTKELGQLFLYGDHVSSTQTLFEKDLAQLPSNAVFVAGSQSTGKGRGKNVWTSNKGCLMFSYKCTTREGSRLPFFPYVVSLALLDSVFQQKGGKNINLRLKWPNDIYANKLKVGGVLCRSTCCNDAFNVTVGVGFNVANPLPTTCLNSLCEEKDTLSFSSSSSSSSLSSSSSSSSSSSTTLLSRPTQQTAVNLTLPTERMEVLPLEPVSGPFTLEKVLAQFLNTFEQYLDSFEKTGFSSFSEDYLKYWLHSDQQVKIRGKDGTEKKVVIKGLTDTGYLKAVSVEQTTEVFELYPDGNSFDFLSGLIVNKQI